MKHNVGHPLEWVYGRNQGLVRWYVGWLSTRETKKPRSNEIETLARTKQGAARILRKLILVRDMYRL